MAIAVAVARGTDQRVRPGHMDDILTGGEHQAQLARNLDDEELSEGSDEENTEERAAESEGENSAEIISDLEGEKVKSVHSGKSSNKETRQATGTCSSCLDDAVLLRSKIATDDWDVIGILGKTFDNTETEDGTEHAGSEGETSLET
jgi:hypothetical protein